jgi:CPA1 family monovalent cation:H+ antiporter
METIPVVLLLLVAVTLLSIAARRVHLPYPAVMVLGGLIISLVPNLPHVEAKPEFLLIVFLPPLLYAAAWQTSWRDFRANLRPIMLLAVGFVVFTTFIVGGIAHWMIPGMTWAAAIALGAIISPPDAIAAVAITDRLGVPKRIVTVLEGESLVNDASGLALYSLAFPRR